MLVHCYLLMRFYLGALDISRVLFYEGRGRFTCLLSMRSAVCSEGNSMRFLLHAERKIVASVMNPTNRAKKRIFMSMSLA